MGAYLISILSSIWETTMQMAPWLLFGFLAAGILSLVVSPAVVGRFLGRTAGQRAIALAIALGVPLPLCSCGVLPVAAGLKRSGASKGAVAAFLLSTPQTGVDSFFATGSLLGWCFALLRPLVAAVTGYVGGVAIQRLDDEVAAAPTVEGEAQDAPKNFGKRCQAALVYGYGTLLKG
ncbi:MAG: permease, partial [Kiritimatiellae bacterium]|nr:permease [Kiritimatiellia bacterium]